MVRIDRNIITKSFSDFLQKVLAKSRKTWYYIKADWFGKLNIRVWRSLVSRLNGVQEALSSNLNTRTKEYYRKMVLFLFTHIVGRTQGLLRRRRPPLNPGPKGNSAQALVSLEFESQHGRSTDPSESGPMWQEVNWPKAKRGWPGPSAPTGLVPLHTGNGLDRMTL